MYVMYYNNMSTIIWKNQLKNSLRGIDKIKRGFGTHAKIKNDERADTSFVGLISPQMKNRIIDSNYDIALLKQVIPSPLENHNISGFKKDPLGENNKSIAKGLLQKYQGRALLTLTSACAIHCRYCFRRHYDYNNNNPLDKKNWEKVLNVLSEQTDINEIILSGGDPLILGDNQLCSVLADLNDIPHISTIRIHTRVPTVLPSRINKGLLALLAKSKKRIVMVVHINHALEIGIVEKESLLKIKNVVFQLLNQSVLLSEVNDSVNTLKNLSFALFECGVLPYYLHYLDPVAGAGHFQVRKKKAKKIVAELRNLLPGYLVPKLVIEDKKAKSKLPL